jgi:hypothetical protein
MPELGCPTPTSCELTFAVRLYNYNIEIPSLGPTAS